MFVREDWTLFRTLGTLCQKAGVPPQQLRRLVAKELIDNALDVVDLDAGGPLRVRAAEIDTRGFVVEDDGRGIDGTPEEIAALLSIRRPLVSSKLLRLPTRGALGNGLRVVAGAVLASGGRLAVWTRDRRLSLFPQDSGETRVEWPPADMPHGSRGVIDMCAAIPDDSDLPALVARVLYFVAYT